MEKAQSENLAGPMRNGRTFGHAMEMFAGIHLPNVVWHICVCVIRIYSVLNVFRLLEIRQMNRCSLRVTPGEREGTVPKNTLLFCRICWKNTFDLLTNPRFCAMIRNGLRDRSIWAHSSAGRAPRSQCGGQGFDPPWVHQSPNRESEEKSVTMVADFSFCRRRNTLMPRGREA